MATYRHGMDVIRSTTSACPEAVRPEVERLLRDSAWYEAHATSPGCLYEARRLKRIAEAMAATDELIGRGPQGLRSVS